MFLACGEVLWDLFAVEGEGSLAFDARIGGSPFNLAVGLARLGQPAALFAGLSTDRLGQRITAALAAEGVETGYLVRSDRPTSLSLIDLDAEGVPTYAIHGEGAADRAIAEADLPALGPEVRGLHAGSFATVVEPVGSALLALFRREAGRRLLSFDPNVRLAVEPDAAHWRARIAAFAAHADIVKASAEDIGLVYPGEAAREVAALWRSAGAGLVIVTHGPAGAEAFWPGGHATAAAPRAEVADTVGAGDSFQAALLAFLAETGIGDGAGLLALGPAQMGAALDFACAAATVTCTRRGADPPRRTDLPPHPSERS